MQHRYRGTITVWDDDKGFGFITPTNGDPALFFHISSVINSQSRDLVGQRVTYELAPGREGKPCAVEVRLAVAGDDVRMDQYRPKQYRSRRGVTFAWVFSLSFLAAVTYVSINFLSPYVPTAYAHLSPYLVLVYVVVSVFTYMLYSHDKGCARSGSWRVSESTLHLMEFLGGWPGALVAQWSLPHKNRKANYQVAFWIIVMIHLVTVAIVSKEYMLPKLDGLRSRPAASEIKIQFL